jgi:hypothetical protein
MIERSAATKTLAVFASLLTLIVTAPFSFGETFAATPLGVIMTPGTIIVGNSVAPTGTTIFAGDRVAATSAPALINLTSGSRIEMTKAVAALSRQGETLVVQASEGLLRFNFLKGEEVRVHAGRYNFTAVGKDSAHVGELGLNQNGQVVLAVSEGMFDSLNTVSGERTVVSPSTPLQATELEGKGALTKGGTTLTDTSKAYKADALKGKCIVAGGEAYPIASNTATVITIKGSWKLNSGTYDYKIADCDKDALIAAGATATAAGTAAAAAAAAGAAAAAAGISTAAVVGIVAGAAAAVGIGVGVYTATKSPSSR